MDNITLKRGDRKVTFEKLGNFFAVRPANNRVTPARAIEECCTSESTDFTHVDMISRERMELYRIDDDSALEPVMAKLRERPDMDVVSHTYSMNDAADGTVIPTGRLTIQFRPEISTDQGTRILNEFGLEVISELDYLDNGYSVRLTRQSTENPLKISAKLQQRPEIITAEPDVAFKTTLQAAPSDTLYPEQWHLNNRGDQLGLVAGADVRAEEAWNISKGTRSIKVCVIDDGFDLEHPDFAATGKIVSPRDFGQNDAIPAPVADTDNHGTACAGVAIAEENGSGVVGLAPRCAFMPVRMSEWLSDETIADMFMHAMNNGADVISCSWSAAAWDFPLSTKMNAVLRKVATEGRTNKKGCVILFAAGNEDRPLDGEKNGKRSYQGFALHPNVIAVGASNSLDRRSGYSNYGPELAIVAPSSGSPGRPIVTTDRRGPQGYSPNDFTREFGGTSSSTPLTAGLAALILSVNPELTSEQVKTLIKSTADKIDPENAGYVDGHSIRYGSGRINAHRALQAAAGDTGTLPESFAIEHRRNKSIPDLGEVEDTIIVPYDVAVKEVEINVVVTHSWRSDLQVILETPQKEQILLHNRAGGSQKNLDINIRSANSPDLFRSLLGRSARGDWVLTIKDLAKQDTGRLVRWGVTVTH